MIIASAIQINAAAPIAPIELTRHLLDASVFVLHAKVVGMSSMLGSIARVSTAFDYSYAISKAAMNMGFMIMAKELLAYN